MEFANPRHRERLLASADIIKIITRGEITIALNDTSISKAKDKEARVMTRIRYRAAAPIKTENPNVG